MPSLIEAHKGHRGNVLTKGRANFPFSETGGGAKDAMEGIADLVAEYLPALVACSVCNFSEEHRLEILGFVDGVAGKLQLGTRNLKTVFRTDQQQSP